MKKMRIPILPIIVAALIGLSVTIAFGVFEWTALIPKELLPFWVHLIFAVLLGLLGGGCIGLILGALHLRNLQRRQNPSES